MDDTIPTAPELPQGPQSTLAPSVIFESQSQSGSATQLAPAALPDVPTQPAEPAQKSDSLQTQTGNSTFGLFLRRYLTKDHVFSASLAILVILLMTTLLATHNKGLSDWLAIALSAAGSISILFATLPVTSANPDKNATANLAKMLKVSIGIFGLGTLMQFVSFNIDRQQIRDAEKATQTSKSAEVGQDNATVAVSKTVEDLKEHVDSEFKISRTELDKIQNSIAKQKTEIDEMKMALQQKQKPK